MEAKLHAKEIRNNLKKEFPECKFSVTTEIFSMGSSISVDLMQAPFQALANNESGYAQVNHYHLNSDNRVSEKAKPLFKKVLEIIDNSKYESESRFIHIGIGKYNKPFIII